MATATPCTRMTQLHKDLLRIAEYKHLKSKSLDCREQFNNLAQNTFDADERERLLVELEEDVKPLLEEWLAENIGRFVNQIQTDCL